MSPGVSARRPKRAEGSDSPEGPSRWFEYVAVRVDGSRLTGRDLAGSELELDRRLESRGLVLLSSREASRAAGSAKARLSRGDLVAFTNQLATMLDAGIPILGSLREIRDRNRSRAVRVRIDDLLADLEAGHSLSEAMGRQDRAFPPLYRATILAGERSTQLPEVLRGQADYLDWIGQIRATTVQALVYPGLLAGAVCGLVVILMTFLLPRLVTLYPGGADDLPQETRFVMAISNALLANMPWILAAGLLAAVGAFLGRRSPRVRIAVARLVLRVPRLGELIRMIATSRFAKTASLLYEAGCEVVETLTMAGGSCGNAYLSSAFARATDRVRRGATIAESLDQEPGMDPFLVQLIAVGETSGDLGGSLRHLTRSYDKEVPRTVKWALSLIEPVVVIVGGVIVLGILLAALLPILSLYENL